MRNFSLQIVTTIAVASSLLIGGGVLAQSSPTPARAILALSKNDHSMAIIDPANLKVICRLPVGPDPHEVIASEDGTTAYVSNTGSGLYHEINVLDLLGQKKLANIDTEALLGPHGLTFVGGKVWFTAEGAKAAASYNPTSGKVDFIIGTGQNRTHMLAVSQDEKRICTTNVASSTVSVIENTLTPPPVTPMGHTMPGAKARMQWNETVIPVGKGAEGFDISKDGQELWTASAHDGLISIIDLNSKKLTATIDAKVEGANRLKFTPDGKHVFISSLRSGDLTVYDAQTRKEVKRIKIGTGGAGILMDGEGNRAFISCSPDNYVAVVDLKTLEVSGHIDVGGQPDGLAWAVSGKHD